MDPAQNKLSPIVQAAIAGALLLMFAGVLFLPGLKSDFHVDADIKQTLFTLVTAVVFFFIGKNTDSASKDAQMTTIAMASNPPTVVSGTVVKTITPASTTEVTTSTDTGTTTEVTK